MAGERVDEGEVEEEDEGERELGGDGASGEEGGEKSADLRRLNKPKHSIDEKIL